MPSSRRNERANLAILDIAGSTNGGFSKLETVGIHESSRSQAVVENRPLSLAVVIPAFNEQHTIAEVVMRARRYAEKIFVVEDGSRDGTYEVLRGLPVTVVRHANNCGKAASLVAGFKSALASGVDAVITIDGDLQHAPEDIPRFIEEARKYPESLVVGSRWERQGRVPALRKAANRFANFWISIACGTRIRDSQCGFRLYPRRLIEVVPARCGRDACFVFESEILINAARTNFAIRFVPIDPIYLPRPYRKSHYRAVRDTTRIFRMVAAKILRGYSANRRRGQG